MEKKGNLKSDFQKILIFRLLQLATAEARFEWKLIEIELFFMYFGIGVKISTQMRARAPFGVLLGIFMDVSNDCSLNQNESTDSATFQHGGHTQGCCSLRNLRTLRFDRDQISVGGLQTLD